jgi:MarR family transcriptional regulator, transcriptional regulator for hemolysin
MDFDSYRSRSTGYMVNLASRLLVREIDDALSEHGLSSAHMPVFLALGGGNAMTQRDLARDAQVEQPTMASTLARMDRDGLITRTPNPADGRSELVSLSELGRSKVAHLRECGNRVNARANAGFTDDERETLLALLARVADNLTRD